MLNIIIQSGAAGNQRLEKTEMLQSYLSDDSFRVWTDLDTPSDHETGILSETFGFHPLAIEDCFDDTQLPKIDDYGNYLFILLHHGAAFSEETGNVSTERIAIFISPRYLVTLHNGPSRTINTLKERLMKNHPCFSKGTDFLFHEILDGIVSNYLPVMDELEEQIGQLEEEVFRNPDGNTGMRIHRVKKNILKMRKATAPQREILNQLSRDELSAITPPARIYFRDIYDRLVHIYEAADSFQLMISSTRDAYLSTISNRLNEVMKVLTVLSTIILPLSLLTGIYGMNFVNIPELRDPNGYFKVLGVMGGIVAGLLIFFRRKEWI